VLGANLAWRYQFATEGKIAQQLRRAARSPLARALYEILRLFYYLGLPYAALLLGWLDVRALGLGFLDWSNGLRWMIVLSLATWSMLMFVWVPYLRATAGLPVAATTAAASWSRRIVEVAYMQGHWAFYRAVCILLLRNFLQDDLTVYWGAAAGIALTFLEAWADPRVRRHVARVGEGELALWSAGQAIINAVGFVLTRNVWVLALIHFALEFSVPHLRAAPAAARSPAQAAGIRPTNTP
jgi:hypothetical protein